MTKCVNLGLMGLDWQVIYSLAGNPKHIEAVQRATLTTKDFGLRSDPHLFGSVEWWDAVHAGRIPTLLLEGTIETPQWGSMGDWPEVVIRDGHDQLSTWTREGDISQYSKGRRIRLAYVIQYPKKAFAGITVSRVLLEVSVEKGAWRPTVSYGPGPGVRAMPKDWEGGPA